MSKEPKGKAVLLPIGLYGKIEEKVTVTEFRSVDEYVIFVLGEVMREDAEEEKSFSKGEEEEVKGRLKALGYMD